MNHIQLIYFNFCRAGWKSRKSVNLGTYSITLILLYSIVLNTKFVQPYGDKLVVNYWVTVISSANNEIPLKNFNDNKWNN